MYTQYVARMVKKGPAKRSWKAKGGMETASVSWMSFGILIGVLFTLLFAAIGCLCWWKMSRSTMKVAVHTEIQPESLPRDVSSLSIHQPISSPRIPSDATPINQPTRGEPPALQTVGLLVSDRRDGVDEPIMMPLMGRPLYVGSQKWEYYAGSDKVHPARIDVSVNSKSCSEETGCDEIYNGDSVFVPTYQRTFTANIYKKEGYRYIPSV